MTLLVCLCLALVVSWYGAKRIKQHANVMYAVATLLSLAMIVITYTGQVNSLPLWVRSYVWPAFANCTLATSCFILVMGIGALRNGSVPMKRLMPIRAELSILACILTLGHNISYGKTYFVMLFTNPQRLSGALLWAALCSVVLVAIMLPLMVTSFPAVRKKMKPKSWKKLQRTAYLFYALIYVHVMLLNTSFLARGDRKYLLNILVYSAVFITYAAMRIRKALLKKRPAAAKTVPAVLAAAATAAVLLICAPSVMPEDVEPPAPGTSESGGSSAVESTAGSESFSESEASGRIEGASGSESTSGSEASGELGSTAGSDSSGDTGSSSGSSAEQPVDAEPVTPEVQYKDGTYFGSGVGFVDDIQVAVMVTDGAISSIIVVANQDDQSYFDDATALLDTIVTTQSTDVDTITGATYTSLGLIEAVENALSTAVG